MEAENIPDPKRIPPAKRTYFADEKLVKVVVRVGIGLGNKDKDVEVVEAKAKIPVHEIQRAINDTIEVISRGEHDKAYGLGEGETLMASCATDATITRNGDSVPSATDNRLTDDELKRLKNPRE